MARLAELQTFSATLNQFGGIFSRIAGASIDAGEHHLAGRRDRGPGAEVPAVRRRLLQRGRAGRPAKRRPLATRSGPPASTPQAWAAEQFRALVEAQDVSTAQGVSNSSPCWTWRHQFAQLADYLTAQGKTLDEAAQAAPQVAMLQQILEQPNPTTDAVVSIGDQITGAVADLKASTEAGPLPSRRPPLRTHDCSTAGTAAATCCRPGHRRRAYRARHQTRADHGGSAHQQQRCRTIRVGPGGVEQLCVLRRRRLRVCRRYAPRLQCIANNTGTDPVVNSALPTPTAWTDYGPTNRWAMFDQEVNTQSTGDSPLSVVLQPGIVNAIALLELVGTGRRDDAR